MVADELDERLRVGLPVSGEALKIFENGSNAKLREERDGVFGVLIKVRIEDALVHEVGFAVDRKEHPAQVMQLENRQTIRLCSHGCFNIPRVLMKNFFASRNDLRRDREAVTRRRLGEDWSVLSLFELIRFLRDSNCARLFPYWWFHARFLSSE